MCGLTLPDHVLSTSLQATFLTSQLGKRPAVTPLPPVVQDPAVKSILQERLRLQKLLKKATDTSLIFYLQRRTETRLADLNRSQCVRDPQALAPRHSIMVSAPSSI